MSVTAAAPPESIDLHGCYDGSWKGLIVDDAFAHPAKFAPGLVRRIYTLMLERGWLAPGDLVGDPFGGIAGGGIIAAYMGIRWVGVELEPRFVELAGRNIEAHRAKLTTVGLPVPEIVQGDSRGFAGLVETVAGCVTSPPFGEAYDRDRTKVQTGHVAAAFGRSYTEARIGGVVTSPPYANQPIEKNSGSVDLEKQYQTYREAGGGASFAAFCRTQAKHSQGYGASEGQIGALPAGDLGAVVKSPPYAANDKSDYKLAADGMTRARDANRGFAQGTGCFRGSETYGECDGQIGRLREEGEQETYWQAVAAVYAQCRLAIRPGGVMVVVVKDYVKAGKVVPLCDGTLALLESLGFEPLARARAHLVKETGHYALDTGSGGTLGRCERSGPGSSNACSDRPTRRRCGGRSS